MRLSGGSFVKLDHLQEQVALLTEEWTGALQDIVTTLGQCPGCMSHRSAHPWPANYKWGTPSFCKSTFLWKDVGRGGQWELAGGMATPSVLTVNQTEISPGSSTGHPALSSQILFFGHKMGPLSWSCPVWWPFYTCGCWVLETWLVWLWTWIFNAY